MVPPPTPSTIRTWASTPTAPRVNRSPAATADRRMPLIASLPFRFEELRRVPEQPLGSSVRPNIAIWTGVILGRGEFHARPRVSGSPDRKHVCSTPPRPRPMTSPQPTSITREQARDLGDTSARGWSKAQVDTLLSAFAPDAIFIETPFADPLQGNEAIRKYWSDVPYHQAEITVATGEIYSAGPWFATEISAW